MENLTFVVQMWPAVSVRALVVFLVACRCSLFVNVGRSSENSFQRVLILLDSIVLLKWMSIGSKGNSSG